MKRRWVCACDSPKATTGELWKREMIKGKLCTMENRAIIGKPAFPCYPCSPEMQAAYSVMGPVRLINELTHMKCSRAFMAPALVDEGENGQCMEGIK